MGPETLKPKEDANGPNHTNKCLLEGNKYEWRTWFREEKLQSTRGVKRSPKAIIVGVLQIKHLVHSVKGSNSYIPNVKHSEYPNERAK